MQVERTKILSCIKSRYDSNPNGMFWGYCNPETGEVSPYCHIPAGHAMPQPERLKLSKDGKTAIPCTAVPITYEEFFKEVL